MLPPQYEDRLAQALTLPVAIGQSPVANGGLSEYVRSWISPGIRFAVGGASFIAIEFASLSQVCQGGTLLLLAQSLAPVL